VKISLTVNGAQQSVDVEARTLLVHLLRDSLGLTATNIGCDTTSCGACTVLVDGESVKSCTMLAASADGRDVTTLEGLTPGAADADPATWHPVQRAFREQHGLQCGFCTPGMVISATALLARTPRPTDEDIRAGLAGNLCRCTGYQPIIAAVRQAATEMAPEAAAAS